MLDAKDANVYLRSVLILCVRLQVTPGPCVVESAPEVLPMFTKVVIPVLTSIVGFMVGRTGLPWQSDWHGGYQ
jgi:hypothetical protein